MPQVLPSIPEGGIKDKLGGAGRDLSNAFYGVAILGLAVLGVSALYRAARQRGLIHPALQPPMSANGAPASQPAWFGE